MYFPLKIEMNFLQLVTQHDQINKIKIWLQQVYFNQLTTPFIPNKEDSSGLRT